MSEADYCPCCRLYHEVADGYVQDGQCTLFSNGNAILGEQGQEIYEVCRKPLGAHPVREGGYGTVLCRSSNNIMNLSHDLNSLRQKPTLSLDNNECSPGYTGKRKSGYTVGNSPRNLSHPNSFNRFLFIRRSIYGVILKLFLLRMHLDGVSLFYLH